MGRFETIATAKTTSRVALYLGCSALVLGLAASSAALAGTPEALKTPAAQQSYLSSHMLNTGGWSPRVLEAPPASVRAHTAAMQKLRSLSLAQTSGISTSVPYWTTTIHSPLDNKNYTVSMVGSSPYAKTPVNTNVTYVPTAVRIHLNGFVLDPSVPGRCDTQSPSTRFYNSPIFKPTTFTSNGVNVSNVPGGTQLISAFQRANFWNAVKGTNYGVTLTPSRPDTVTVDWYPNDPADYIGGVYDNCGHVIPIAVVNINEFNDELLSIAASYAKPNQVPITVANDVAIYVGNSNNNCCVLGYHNAVSVPGGTQLYSVGAYFDTNHVFGGRFPDITVWVHELGELIDDPFVQSIGTVPGGYANDLTPAWGHTGQVYGCQNNLETGDPLTPAQLGNFGVYPVTGVGGFVYHYQDLAFHDWFYRTPSTSTGGAGSFQDNLAGGGQPQICS